MAKEITENTQGYGKLQSIDTGQLEYSIKQVFIYGSISAALLTLGITYLYLLIQKIKN